MTSPQLGRRMHFYAVALKGSLSPDGWREFLVDVAGSIDMVPVGEAAVWTYPVNGEGGTGLTVCQPITESFIAVDIWPDHLGAYLVVCSCRLFHPLDLKYLIGKYDLVAGEEAAHRLELK